MTLFGEAFAPIYNDECAYWGPHVGPLLLREAGRSGPPPGNWLDLCCGAGSLLKIVCEHGYDATGLDLSGPLLRYARVNAPRARLLRADVRTFAFGCRFDVITCMFDSLNYLPAREDVATVFTRTREHLADGGLFAFDVNTFGGLRPGWERSSVVHGEDRVLINETSFDTAGRLHCRITGFVKTGDSYRRFDEQHVQLGYSAARMKFMLGRAGFRFTVRDGHTLGRRRRKSSRLLYLCRAR